MHEKCLVFWWDTISYIIYLLPPLFCEAWQLSQHITPRQLIQTPDRRVTVTRKDGKSWYVNETSVCLDPWFAFLRISFFYEQRVSFLAVDCLRLIDVLSVQVFRYLSKQLPMHHANFCLSAEPFKIAFQQRHLETIICRWTSCWGECNMWGQS